jgi:hypothetical protein
MSRRPLLGAIALILATNVLALIGVGRNRAGGPAATIELTERELPIMNTGMDNSAIDLGFSWTRQSRWRSTGILNCSQLEQAGFDLRSTAGEPASDVALLPREAFVALEYQGSAWKQWLQGVEEERRQSQSSAQPPIGANIPVEPLLQSRLFVVDAAKSPAELRARYPDPGKHLIVRAVIMARLEDVKEPGTGKVISHNCIGNVSEILPAMIHVPLPYARLLALLKPRLPGEEPRFAVSLHYGRNLEPWVASVKLR